MEARQRTVLTQTSSSPRVAFHEPAYASRNAPPAPVNFSAHLRATTYQRRLTGERSRPFAMYGTTHQVAVLLKIEEPRAVQELQSGRGQSVSAER